VEAGVANHVWTSKKSLLCLADLFLHGSINANHESQVVPGFMSRTIERAYAVALVCCTPEKLGADAHDFAVNCMVEHLSRIDLKSDTLAPRPGPAFALRSLRLRTRQRSREQSPEGRTISAFRPPVRHSDATRPVSVGNTLNGANACPSPTLLETTHDPRLGFLPMIPVNSPIAPLPDADEYSTGGSARC
jgi:hypothetical protein